METIGMRNDHAEFKKRIDNFKTFRTDELVKLLEHLEKRIRELEFRINNK